MAEDQITAPTFWVSVDFQGMTWGALRKFVALGGPFADDAPVDLEIDPDGFEPRGLRLALTAAEIAPGEGSL